MKKTKRRCDECGTIMQEGFVIRDGEAYYCDKPCLRKHFTPAEWEKETEDLDTGESSSQSYWTQWESIYL